MTDKEIVERAKAAEKKTGFGELVHSPISKGVNSAYGIGFIDGMEEYRNSFPEKPVSKDLEKAAEESRRKIRPLFETFKESTGEPVSAYDQNDMVAMFKAGAMWQKQITIDKANDWLLNNWSNYVTFENGIIKCYNEMISDLNKYLDK